jgi:hypothetical protein
MTRRRWTNTGRLAAGLAVCSSLALAGQAEDVGQAAAALAQQARLRGAAHAGPVSGARALASRILNDQLYLEGQYALWSKSAVALDRMRHGLEAWREHPEEPPRDSEIRDRRQDLSSRLEALLPRTETKHGARPDPSDLREVKRLTGLIAILDRELEANKNLQHAEHGERGHLSHLETEIARAALDTWERRRRLEWAARVDAEAVRLLRLPVRRR